MTGGDQRVEVRGARAEVQGRYLLRRAASSAGDGAPLLVCLHGYGENAERLLEAVVEVPVASAWHLVAIQALHPFYNPRTGEVLASWMTKLDREAAIRDNTAYVAAVVGEVKELLGADERTLVYLGFSQGTAMAYRAAFGSGHDCAGVVALAGDFPGEIVPRDGGAHPQVLIGRGTEDEWYDEAKMENDLARLSAFDVDVETCVFDGGHEWSPEFRSACADFLRRL